MVEEQKIPLLLQLYFGEAAEKVQRGASERLMKWCEAFEAWLLELKQQYRSQMDDVAMQAWKRLARTCAKLPWELETADIEQHAAWLHAEGYSPSMICKSLSMQARFYRWCDERRIDAETPAGFNPAAGVSRPKVERYAGATMLSRGEVERLLGALRADKSPLGLRERAFILARLRTGVPLIRLQQLRWGQIEVDKAGAWVRWEKGGERRSLPGEVWQAMRDYLEASGRLGEMREETFIFAPLLDPLAGGVGDQREEWAEARCQSPQDIGHSLRLYGRLAHIQPGKLSMRALQRTATRLRLDAGASTEEMRLFLDSRDCVESIKCKLRKLPSLPEDEAGEPASQGEYPVPLRVCGHHQPGEYIKHGLYSKKLLEPQVAAVMAEGAMGMDEELAGLKVMENMLQERCGKVEAWSEKADLMQALSTLLFRENTVSQAVSKPKKVDERDAWAEEFLAALSKVLGKTDGKPDLEAARGEAREWAGETQPVKLSVNEAIASMRLVLRNAYKLATESQEASVLVKMANIYGLGCVRLARLLKTKEGEEDNLSAYLNHCINQAIEELTEEWGLDDRTDEAGADG